MHLQFKTALALVFATGLALNVRATPQRSSGEPLTASQVRKAEVEAKTAAEQIQLEAYYLSKAGQTRSKLADSEGQLKNWCSMERSPKVPNAYTTLRSKVEYCMSSTPTASRPQLVTAWAVPR
jgi:hypothetical protein